MPISVWGLLSKLLLITGGFIGAGFWSHKLFFRTFRFQQSVFLFFVTGIVLFYALVLIGLRLDLLLLFLKINLVAALVFFCFHYFKNRREYLFTEQEFVSFIIWGLFLVICSWMSYDCLKYMLYSPLRDWDARSIWFFRTKQLFYGNGFNEASGIYNHPFSVAIHGEYPFLIPSLGALILKEFDFYNEYLPKANLLLLWLGILLAFISLKRVHIVCKLVVLYCLLRISPMYLSNGYMDIWLGIYAFLSILFLIEFFRTREREYLFTASATLVAINYFKNDAALIVASLLLSIGVLLVCFRNRRLPTYLLGNLWKGKFLILLLFVPYFVWFAYKYIYQVNYSDFDFTLLFDVSRWDTVFTSKKYDLIFEAMISQSHYMTIFMVSVILVLMAVIYMKQNGVNSSRIKTEVLVMFFPLLASLLFFLGMLIMYSISRLGLEWHLSTSADRVRTHMVFMCLATFYGVLSLFLSSPVFKLRDHLLIFFKVENKEESI